MEDIYQPLIIIVIGGLFAPILTQLLEKLYSFVAGTDPSSKPNPTEEKSIKRKKWLRFLLFAITIQLVLFTIFFIFSKITYFDKNYFETSERELIREGLKKHKDYIIPKITIRIYSESTNGIPFIDTACSHKKINYCMLVSISYEIIALREFNSEKIFPEEYTTLYATKIVKEPGSELETDDQNPSDQVATYDVTTTMKKFERKTITTRADYLYDSIPLSRKFFERMLNGSDFDMFYYQNSEDDVIGEVEFQIISRTLKLLHPNMDDAIYENASKKETSINPQLIQSNGQCLNFNIITTKIPRLFNNEQFGIKWSWTR